MVMIGLTLIGAAGATWAGQENAQTVWLDQSLWDSLKSGQCKRLDNDVVVARTARGMFVWCPAAPTEAHGTGANQADAALDKIQEALDSILGRGVLPPPAPEPPAKGRREPEDIDDDDLSDAALDRIQAELDRALTDAQTPPPPASGWEIAGDIQELRECARSYSEAPKDNIGALRYTVECIIQDTPEGSELRAEAAQALAPLADANQKLYQTLMQKLGAGS